MKSLFIFTLLLTATAFANPESVCNDLHRLTCAYGDYDDGTGVASTPGITENIQNFTANQLRSSANKKFADRTGQSKNVYFRQLLLSASGLSLHPDCKEGDVSPSAKCLELLAGAGAEVAIRSILGEFRGARDVSSLTDIVKLIESEEFVAIREELSNELAESSEVKKITQMIKDEVLEDVKEIMIARLDEIITDPAVKRNLRSKITAISFDESLCGESYGAQAISPVVASNAIYNQARNTFGYCGGLSLLNTSRFRLAYAIAHELSHAVDPCGITLGPSDYAFKYNHGGSRRVADTQFPVPIIECLRTNSSAYARVYDAETGERIRESNGQGGSPYGGGGGGYADYAADEGYYAQEEHRPPPFNSYCTSRDNPVYDQIVEVFPDWMAAEILPRYVERYNKDRKPPLSATQLRFGYSNVWRGYCQFGQKTNSDAPGSHPDFDRRINHILLMNPDIRNQMNCPASVDGRQYCSADSAAVAPANAPVTEQPRQMRGMTIQGYPAMPAPAGNGETK